MLRDDARLVQFRPFAGCFALLNLLAVCLAGRQRKAQALLWGVTYFLAILVLVMLSTIIFLCGHEAIWVGGLTSLFVALFGLLSGVTLVFFPLNLKRTVGRLRCVVNVATCMNGSDCTLIGSGVKSTIWVFRLDKSLKQ
jgi:hypothetical protein